MLGALAMTMISQIFKQLIFWMAWIIIPLAWEVIRDFGASMRLFANSNFKKKSKVTFKPTVTILIPVYNSERTLINCLLSVINQNYPTDLLNIILIDNGSSDLSYEVYKKFQQMYSQINMWWYFSHQGKANALNKGIFGSTGKYVINIDSDGWLHKDAIRNIVRKFEENSNINCLTGAVLIDHHQIKNTKNGFKKLLRKCEFFEYVESFLIGRNAQSIYNDLYSISGAFSCFRLSSLSKTQLFNNMTVGEDTHMTFQIRNYVGGRIELCEDAFLFLEPTGSINELYCQRQRWQRGEIETANMYLKNHIGGNFDYFTKFAQRILINDHTLAFPRLMCYFAVIYLFFINYPLSLIVGANLLIYLMYVLSGFLYFLLSLKYLNPLEVERSYFISNWYMIFVTPIYRFMIYWIRMAGIINTINTSSKWKVRDLNEEFNLFSQFFQKNIFSKFKFLDKIRKVINNE